MLTIMAVLAGVAAVVVAWLGTRQRDNTGRRILLYVFAGFCDRERMGSPRKRWP